MRSKKRIIITVLVCVGIAALAYFACMIPFYIFETNDFNTSIEKLLSLDYLKTLVPLLIIVGLSALGIILIVLLRRMLAKRDKNFSRSANVRTGRAGGKAPKQKPAVFMIIRWIINDRFCVYDDLGRTDIRAWNVEPEHTGAFMPVEHRTDDGIELLLSFAPERAF